MNPIEKPLEFIDNYYENLLQNKSTIFLSNNFNISLIYKEIIKENLNYKKEILKLGKINLNKKIVRYRCLIQDIKNPEFYIGVYKSSITSKTMLSKYRDTIENDEIDPNSELYFERQPIIGISIPGERQQDQEEGQGQEQEGEVINVDSCLINIYDQQNDERHLKLHDMIEVIGICSIISPLQSLNHNDVNQNDIDNVDNEVKYELENEEQQVETELERNISENKLDYPRKKQKREIKSNVSINMDFLQEFSIEETELLFSHSLSSSSLFYSNQTNPIILQKNSQSNMKLKFQIDCLFYEQIQSSYPLYSSICDSEFLSEDFICNHSFQLRDDEIISYIPQLFHNILNDSLVSQYLTYGILSHVYNRVDITNPVGNFPLNIFNSPSYDSIQFRQLIKTIKSIVPRVIEIVLDHSIIENTSYQLVKDDITNTLSSSPFQLGEHTVIIIYETELFQERIKQNKNKNVEKNIEVITNLLFQQILTTNFNYYSLNVPINYPMIIFSKNQSYFQSPRLISLPIQSEVSFNENNQTIHQLNEINTLNYKIWWSKCMKLNQNITMNSSLIEQIENDYITYRQLNDQNILSTVDNLQNILTLTRLHTVNCNENEITLKHWSYILNLENSRKLRNQTK